MKSLVLFLLGSVVAPALLFGQSPSRAADVKLKLISDQLSHPVAFAVAPGDPAGRLFVCEQEGRIRIIEKGQLSPQPFLDVTQEVVKKMGYDERGLLGLAFPPELRQKRKILHLLQHPVIGPGKALTM